MRATKQSLTLQRNPKSQALSPKQILISKFKAQNPFGHWKFEHLMLFRVLIFALSFCILIFAFDIT